MTDEEYKKFLTVLAAKHIRKGAIGDFEDFVTLQKSMRNLTRLSRLVQDLRDEPIGKRPRDGEGPTKDFLQELKQTPVSEGFAAMERAGILEALHDATDAVFSNLRRSAIPDEDVEFLYRAGISNPELEITITIEIRKE